MSGRILKYQVDNLVEAAVSDATSAELLSLQIAENDLIARCVEQAAADQGLVRELAAARRVAPGWITLHTSVYTTVGSLTIDLQKRTGVGIENKPFIPGRLFSNRMSIDPTSPLGMDIIVHSGARKDHKERVSMLKTRVRALVESVTTLKRLKEVWPEGEPYWSRITPKVGFGPLPVPKVNELNQLLGLPKETVSA